jgi:prevent-host-death family protein
MIKINATDARNNIGKLWETASQEAVTVESAGKPIAVVLSPDAYDKLIHQRKPRQVGFAKHLLTGVDVDALLATPVDDVFEGYLE